jgi:serine/threonine-protein kinase
MSDTAPSRPAADRNLLFGVLALQMDFISRDALIRAMNAWVLEKTKPLGQILEDQGALRGDAHTLLEALVRKHLELHSGDPERSLASVSSLGSAREDLRQIADPDVQASLARMSAAGRQGQDAHATPASNCPTSGGPATDADPYATRPPSVGTPTSSGLRFRILRPHARGGLGEVFVALDEELGREVALKEIQDRHADHPESRARFLLEAEVTGGLEHPGIVPVYGLGTYADGRPYYAMRFIRGDSLRDAIARFHGAEKPGRDPGERALELRQLLGRFVDVCQAIAYAHSRGVLHRDLKPGNIMLGHYGETLVVDWGLAKPTGRPEGDNGSAQEPLRPPSASGSAPTWMGSALGTPQFMSPEQAAGRLDLLGPGSDVYGLGATLYCLLTGKVPFEGDDVGTILRRVQQGDFPPPRQIKGGVPAALEAVCLKAMAMKPEDRYGSAQALAGDVEHWLADEPVAAYREPWPVRANRWVRRHRTAVTGVAAAVAVAAVSLAVATVLLGAANRRERQAKERADANLAKARKAVEDFCTNVSEDKRLKQADLHALRKKLLETAVPFYQEFVQQRGDDPGLQADRGRAFRRLGSLRGEIGEKVEAEADYRRAVEVFGELVRLHPSVPEYRQELARTHNNLGIVLRARGQDKEAEATFGKDPQTVEPRRSLRDAHWDRAEALMKLARDADAVKDWDRAIELDKGSDRPRFRLWRSLALARAQTGDYAQTVADAVALAEAKGAKDIAVYDAARVCALASVSVKKDAKLADQYAARAVELLAKARAAGYFKDATDVENMKKDSDLASLRSRDDFQKLLAQLKEKAKAGDP